MGSLTFSTLARLNEYRTNTATTAKEKESQATPISPISSQIPTGKVDARTEQALVLSGLDTTSDQDQSSLSTFFANPEASSYQFTAPDLDFTYNLASIKGILAYRDVLLARNSDETAPESGQNLSEKS